MEFFKEQKKNDQVSEWIKFDFLSQGNLRLPGDMLDTCPDKEWIFEFLKDPQNIATFLNIFANFTPKKIYNQVKFQYFSRTLIDHFSESTTIDNEQGLLVFFETGFSIIC